MKVPKAKKQKSGAWRCQVMVDGERRSVTKDTEKEAIAEAMRVKAGLEQEKRREKGGYITLKEAVGRYIEEHMHVLSPSTLDGYEEIGRNRFQRVMRKKLSSISIKSLQEAVNEEAGAGVSAKTIRNAVGLVSAVMSYFGFGLDIDRIKLPQRKKKEHAIMSAADIIELFDHIQGNLVEVPILLAVWLGMRRSEIMGLCWDCVDAEKNTISIRRTYIRGRDGYVLRDGTKTEASRRTLDCPAYIMDKLLALRPEKYDRTDRIFKMHPNTIYQSMRRICEREGINFVGVHGLRHTNASVMLSLGVVDKAAMARGGWSTDVTMKQIYQHLFREDLDAATIMVNQFFGQIAEGVNPYELHFNLHSQKKSS